MAQNVEYIISLRDRFSGKLTAIQTKMQKFKSNMSSMNMAMSGLFVGGAMTFAAKGLLKMASDAEETSSKFDVVFKSVGASANKVAENLRKNYGLSSKASKQLLSDTGDLLTGFGFTGKQALGLSEEVNKLAVDLASFTNFEGGAEGASQALTKALLGERESVKALGIAILDKDVKARIKQMDAMGKLKGLTDRQKTAYATLTIAQEQSKNSIGDFARTQDGFANKLRTLKSRWDDLSIEITSKFLPALGSILDSGFNVIAMLQKNAGTIVHLIKIVFQIAKYYIIYLGVLRAISIALKVARIATVAYRIAVVVLGRGIKSAMTLMKSFKASMVSTGIGALVLGITWLAEKMLSLSNATDKSTDAQEDWNKAQERAEKIANKRRIEDFLQKAGVAQVVKLGTQELVDYGSINQEKLDKVIKSTPLQDLTDLGGIFSDQLMEAERALENLDIKDAFSLEIKQNELNKVISTYKAALAKIRKETSKHGGVGLTPQELAEGGGDTKATKITSAAPKVFNINIDKLVENFSVSTNTLKESTGEVKEAVLNALLGALNDTQIVLNQ